MNNSNNTRSNFTIDKAKRLSFRRINLLITGLIVILMLVTGLGFWVINYSLDDTNINNEREESKFSQISKKPDINQGSGNTKLALKSDEKTSNIPDEQNQLYRQFPTTDYNILLDNDLDKSKNLYPTPNYEPPIGKNSEPTTTDSGMNTIQEEESYEETDDGEDHRHDEQVEYLYQPKSLIQPQNLEVTPIESSSEPIKPQSQLRGFTNTIGIYNGQNDVPVNQEFSVVFDTFPSDDVINNLQFYPKAEFEKSRSNNQLTIKPKRLARDTDYIFGLQFAILCQFGNQSCQNSNLTGWYKYSLSFETDWKETLIYGYSRQGRPLISYIFGTANENGKRIMLSGGIHGTEWRSGGLTKLKDYLWNRPEELANRNKVLIIVPEVNPDGIAANTVDNASRVNLNRNWPAYWNPCVRCGISPASEPETSALLSFTLIEKVTHQISYHAQWPPNGMIFLGDDYKTSTRNFAEWVSNRTGYPIGFFPNEPIVSGDQSVWGETQGITSILIESTLIASDDWDKNFPMYLDLLRWY